VLADGQIVAIGTPASLGGRDLAPSRILGFVMTDPRGGCRRGSVVLIRSRGRRVHETPALPCGNLVSRNAGPSCRRSPSTSSE
jgi:hypothetical protein